MKNFRIIWVLMSSLVVSTASADQTATARLHCRSLRFSSATSLGGGGGEWQLSLTTLGSSINGELSLDPFDTGYTHSSDVVLYEWLTDFYIDGFMALDTPYGGDANGNGFDDFFDVSQSVSGLVSAGFVQLFGWGAYDVQATWSRNAGSATGVCVYSIPDPLNSFVTLTFYHTFQLIEYNGVLFYTPGVSNVNCVLLVTNAPAEDVLDGPLIFEKSPTNAYNELLLQSAFLTNDSPQVLSLYTNTTFLHDMDYPTNYYGYVELVDGDLNTVDEDYFSWLLSIDDTNDADQDGIPDFSDDLAVVPPAQPALSIALGPNNVRIALTGEVGRMHEIKSVGSLSDTNWVTVHSVMLTNSPQTESLPKPTETTFWRAVALP